MITRRDFLNASLAGAGSMLMGMPPPLDLMKQSGKDWNDYGGVGDYTRSNGNTWEVVSAAAPCGTHCFCKLFGLTARCTANYVPEFL